MRAPRSLTGTIALIPAWPRRIVLAVLIVICLALTFFPQKYRSAATLAPADPGSLGLAGAVGQLGAANSVFGNQAAVEVTVRVASSLLVRQAVIDRLNLMQRLHFDSRIEAHRWLARQVGVRSLRGGIVQMETTQRDPIFADQIISTYAEATRARLAVINRQQTSYKRQVLEKLVSDAGNRLDRAQTAYDNFRLRTRYTDPTTAIEAIGGRIPALEAAIKAKDVQLNSLRAFATEDNIAVQQVQAELAALRRQLAQQQALNPEENGSVGRVVRQSTLGERLERELNLALSLYEGYKRFLQGTSVEDLTSTANLRVIEPPFVDTQRQINLPFAALTLLLLLVAGAIEFYQLRPPLEARRPA